MSGGASPERHETFLSRRNNPFRPFVAGGDETGKASEVIRKTLGGQVPPSSMGQYVSAYRSVSLPGVERRLSPEEHGRAVRTARRPGHHDVFIRETVH